MPKDQRITLRVDKDFKRDLEALAKSERRSVASMIEVAVSEYMKKTKTKR